MPAPPPDPPATSPLARHPARVMLDSPLAAASRARVYRRRTRQLPRERWRRVLAMVGTLLVHLLFLFGFVLGPAYQTKIPPPAKQQALQVRLIELPEPPPPPPVRGTPPKEIGPRHQGHGRPATASRQRQAEKSATATTALTAAAVTPRIAQAATPRAATPPPVAAPPPPVSLPTLAPTPSLQPIPLTGVPPSVTLPTPRVSPPQPPKFHPEPVRPRQLEGNQPVPPPPSLAMPELPPPAPPPIAAPSLALNLAVATPTAPASLSPARAPLPAAPPLPALEAIPLPAPAAPTLNLPAALSVPAPRVPRELPRVQAPAIQLAQSPLDAVPLPPVAQRALPLSPPTLKIAVAAALKPSAVQPPLARPELSAPAPAALPVSQSSSAHPPAPVPGVAAATTPAITPVPAASPAAPEAGRAGSQRDVSTAPDATPHGSDSVIIGTPEGVAAAPEIQGKAISDLPATSKQGAAKGSRGKSPRAGQTGGNQPGVAQGVPHADQQGALGGYVQLKPQGDTKIMNHGSPNIGYKPTRFDKDWTPQDESSVDTALRRAVEKTTVKHTFHLPRGVRVECAVRPLLPIALFGCRNPDPPPAPVAQKVYDRLYLPPANPLVPATPASVATPTHALSLKLDNSALCATAHVAGAPPPPGCETLMLPVKLAPLPASSSTSWVPASDQFH